MKVAIFLTVVAFAAAHDFTKCVSNDQLGVSAVDLSPDPVVSGQNLLVKLAGTSSIPVSGGTATLSVKAFGVVIATVTFDLCTQVGIKCPSPAGAWTGGLTYPVPKEAPGGITATCQIVVKDTAGNEVSCISMQVKIVKQSEQYELHSEQSNRFLFTSFVKQHRKQYDVSEFFDKFERFSANLKEIVEFANSGAGWQQEMNEFGDLSREEFNALYLGYRPVDRSYLRSQNEHQRTLLDSELASSVDWTTKGAVTPVKNQGQCGSCWSFSTTGSVEGAVQIATGKLTSLSEQQLVDCAGSAGNSGCNGGLMDNAFEWIIKNGGIASEDSYPYTAQAGNCNTQAVSVSTISGYKDVKQGDESSLLDAVSKGPVSIAIEADQKGFQFYSGGVMDGTCGKKLDHGVLIVGYGTDGGKDYWKIKNSWGGSWGEKGYIRIIRGRDQCGVADSASYPVA